MGRVAAQTQLLVVADPEGKRIGSGGATLHVLRQQATACGPGRRVLVIHAGGDSRRLPWASVLGKAFIPVPFLADPDHGTPTLLEHCMAAAAGLPAQLPRGGMVCLSGDVLPLVDPQDLRLAADGVTVVAAPAPLATALRHGIIVARDGDVVELLQKPSAAALAAAGGLLPGGQALIDTGIWSVAGSAFAGLCALATHADDPVAELLRMGVECSLYEDIAAAWVVGRGAWLAERPLGARLAAAAVGTPPLRACVCPGLRFLHFGTGTEVADHLGRSWEGAMAHRILTDAGQGADPEAIVLHCACDPQAVIGAGSLVYRSRLGAGVRVGQRSVLVGADLSVATIDLGDHRALWQVAVAGTGWATALAGVDDNPKEAWPEGRFLNRRAGAWMDEHGVLAEDLWPAGAVNDGWNARLFPIGDGRDGLPAIRWMLAEGDDVRGDQAGASAWRCAERVSLADLARRLDARRQAASGSAVESDLILGRLRRIAAGAVDGDAAALVRTLPAPQPAAIAALANATARMPAPAHRRLRLAGDLLVGTAASEAYAASWRAVAESVAGSLPLATALPVDRLAIGAASESRLPVRIDLAGGWSDTPPICLDMPARVLNLAATIDGVRPIGCRVRAVDGSSVTVRARNKVARVLDAASVDAPARIDDPDVLLRLALQVCGFVRDGRLAIGLEVEVWSDIPKGSGLGGSSILAAAIVQALQRLAGRPDDPATVSALVLTVEQRLTTGGGWQDQIGGLVPGVKLLSSLPVRPLSIAFVQLKADTMGAGFRMVGDLSGADRMMNEALFVGTYPGLRDEHLAHIAAIIRGALG